MKMMVVDDEALILEKIVYLLRHCSLPFESIMEAGNGQEALGLMEDGYRTDIMLTDIRMPIIDGIQLIERVREQYPHVRIVVISGYAEFEYAVKAMQLGVTSYVLKPVKAQELVHAVESEWNQLIAERERVALSERVLFENKRNDFEELLSGWLTCRYDDETFRNRLAGGSDMCNYPVYGATIILLHAKAEFDRRHIVSTIRGLAENDPNAWWMLERPFGEDRVVLIYGGRSEPEFCNTVKQRSDYIYEKLQERKDLTATVGIGFASEIRAAYRKGISALKQRFLHGGSGVYVWKGDFPARRDISRAFLFQVKLTEQRLEHAAPTRAKQLLMEFMNEIFVNNAEKYLAETSINYLFNECINMMIRYGVKNNFTFWEHVDQEVFSGKAIDAIEDCQGIAILLEELLVRMFDQQEAGVPRREGLHSSLIDNVIQYIERSTFEEITLQAVSLKYAVNPSYLSRAFKAATGQGFIKFVTDKRVERAKELLVNSRMEIVDIAQALGFSDQQYFNRVYKKTTGFTPNEWRMKGKNNPKNA